MEFSASQLKVLSEAFAILAMGSMWTPEAHKMMYQAYRDLVGGIQILDKHSPKNVMVRDILADCVSLTRTAGVLVAVLPDSAVWLITKDIAGNQHPRQLS